MSFLKLAAEERVSKNSQLMKLKGLIDWSKIEKILKRIRTKALFPQGRKPYNATQLFKAVLLGQWYNLSDPQLEESLLLRMDVILFTGFDDEVPDETTLCRFRNKLTEKKIWEILLQEINDQLSYQGLQVKECEGAIVDATLIESSCRPRRTIEMKIAEDRKEEEIDKTKDDRIPQIVYSKDKEAKWLKKGRKFHYGYKGFVVTDKAGYIQDVHLTPANNSEMKEFSNVIGKVKAKQRVYADKGYASQKNREELRSRQIKSGIMYKAQRGHKLSQHQKLFNRIVSQSRFVVERCFGTIKRRFNFWRSSYMGCDKTLGQLLAKSICVNLLKAVRRVDIVCH